MSFKDFLMLKGFMLAMVTESRYLETNPIISVLTILFKPWFMMVSY